MGETAGVGLRPFRKVGSHLGYIVLVSRIAIKSLHGPGGKLEGFPVDWVSALVMACYHVNNWLAQHGEFDG